ncbi:FitA-like ribbon-helix-helix domain-containing protein [Gymnodinialimonas hymeniacidonis]
MAENDLEIEISDELYAAIAKRAKTNKRTPEEEARAILIAALRPDLNIVS